MVDALSLSALGFVLIQQCRTGKSFGSVYFLLRLLAIGQSVFYINDDTFAYYFSSSSVQKTREHLYINSDPVNDALKTSWVVIDMDRDAKWTPALTFDHARCVLWTSPSRETRMAYFDKRFSGENWFMKGWLPYETAVVACTSS